MNLLEITNQTLVRFVDIIKNFDGSVFNGFHDDNL